MSKEKPPKVTQLEVFYVLLTVAGALFVIFGIPILIWR